VACTRLRKLIDMDQPGFGLWVCLADPAVVEIAAYAGYDFVNIDLEHSSLDLPGVANMLRAATACGISALVRIPGNDANMILRVVELGPDGIIIPHIHDAQDARRAVTAAKYAPLGDRGMSAATRSARYGIDEADFLSYTARINRELIIYGQIEDKSGLTTSKRSQPSRAWMFAVLAWRTWRAHWIVWASPTIRM
jgi:2-keto-3-deoxy-L-rhamnonate aldolase RhmA